MAGELPCGAEPITPAHAPRLEDAFSAAGKRLWCYYAPFLCCYSLPPRRQVLLADGEHGLRLLVLHSTPKGRHVDLLVPPVPFSQDGLDATLRELRAVNGERPMRILWADQEDAGRLDIGSFAVRPKDADYLYDPARIVAASGREYRDLRKRLNRFRREAYAQFRCMGPEDLPACQELLKHWRHRQGRKQPFLLDWGYTRAALERYEVWSGEILKGWVVLIQGRVRAFAFGGRMQEGLANFFVAKTDPDVFGLSEFLRWNVYAALSGYALVNDAGDLGIPGLRQHKLKFRPVERLAAYTAVARPQGDV